MFVITFIIVLSQTTFNSDYYYHVGWAADLRHNIFKQLPYPLWHIGV